MANGPDLEARVSALGVRTAARFDRMDERIDGLEAEVRAGFTEMRGKLDQTATGLQQIVTLLTDDGPVAQ